MRPKLLASSFLGVCLAVLTASAAESLAVHISESPAIFILSNGVVTARINKSSGEFSLNFQGQEVITRGYWSQVGRSSAGDIARFASKHSSAITIDPAHNQAARGEVACRFDYSEGSGGLPCNVEMRYAMGAQDKGLYVYAIWEHRPGFPSFSVGEARHALKLNSAFDYLAIDANRHGVLPSGADWDQGEPLNMKEVRRIKTGPFAGRAEHKYDYSAILAETPAYGWASTKKQLGVWLVNPSIEYLAGGPTKVELTGHLDVNPGGAPTLLNMWHGSHYGGSSLAVKGDESWRKVIGPFFYYCNSGGEPAALWKDALAKAKTEEAAWPYSWVAHPDYPHAAARGSAIGKIKIDDPAVSSLGVSNLWVGLAAAPYEGGAGRRNTTVDWQLDSKHYQFWSRASGDGTFKLQNIRPGIYSLYAFADGVLGEYNKADVKVREGASVDLGTLVWKPIRFGKQLWEIGVPNRSAEEFRHGDDYWHWGLYYDYPKEFPNDVNFVIGKSDWRKDWNYCQPPRISGNRAESTTWSITFELPEIPKNKATLRLAIAGSRISRGIDVLVNGKLAGNSGPLPDTGVMHRDGIRGYWCERAVAFDRALLKSGTNRIQLQVPARGWVEGVLYDYLRLEAE
jgi:rhamnogalacturonan endolyase